MQSSTSQPSKARKSRSKSESAETARANLVAMGGALERLVARAADPLGGWSLQVLAQAERRAAKSLITASTQLERAASRLDAARLKLAARQASPTAGDPHGAHPGALDEMCPPHLA